MVLFVQHPWSWWNNETRIATSQPITLRILLWNGHAVKASMENMEWIKTFKTSHILYSQIPSMNLMHSNFTLNQIIILHQNFMLYIDDWKNQKMLKWYPPQSMTWKNATSWYQYYHMIYITISLICSVWRHSYLHNIYKNLAYRIM